MRIEDCRDRACVFLSKSLGIVALILAPPCACKNSGIELKLRVVLAIYELSLLYLGGAAILFCFLSLGQVIAALVVLRIVVQFLLQHIGVMLLRRTQPGLRRPFRMWLYPLPPLLALAGFTYILLGRPNFQRELVLAAVVVALGAAAYLLRERLQINSQRSDQSV